jgi:hypothetical protein
LSGKIEDLKLARKQRVILSIKSEFLPEEYKKLLPGWRISWLYRSASQFATRKRANFFVFVKTQIYEQ